MSSCDDCNQEFKDDDKVFAVHYSNCDSKYICEKCKKAYPWGTNIVEF